MSFTGCLEDDGFYFIEQRDLVSDIEVGGSKHSFLFEEGTGTPLGEQNLNCILGDHHEFKLAASNSFDDGEETNTGSLTIESNTESSNLAKAADFRTMTPGTGSDRISE